MKFFHRTRAKNAASILKRGFQDATGNYMMNTTVTGVWVSDKILDGNEGACGDTVLQIEVKISKRDLDFYEVKEEGKPYREWCIPARIAQQGKNCETAGRDAIASTALDRFEQIGRHERELIYDTRTNQRTGRALQKIRRMEFRASLFYWHLPTSHV